MVHAENLDLRKNRTQITWPSNDFSSKSSWSVRDKSRSHSLAGFDFDDALLRRWESRTSGFVGGRPVICVLTAVRICPRIGSHANSLVYHRNRNRPGPMLTGKPRAPIDLPRRLLALTRVPT